ncbi:unnamed protein product [Callosobruchus maculatus]|uniref:Uncharacterized protein n=1 Tax=Callosobruchus maculatus TaxID=64391 RepID=A0A653BEJ0_CALMS|nr:unnamed protein product [Callosobruchus maculatus]
MVQETERFTYFILIGLLGVMWRTAALEQIPDSHFNVTHEYGSCYGFGRYSQKVSIYGINVTDRDPSITFPDCYAYCWYHVTNSSIPRLRQTLFPDWDGYTIIKIDLRKANIHTIDNGTWNSLKYLHCLDLSKNRLNEISRSTFAADRLTYLNLSSNNIVSLQKYTFTNIHNLHYLDISKNQIQKIEGNAFGGLAELIALNLSSNNLYSLYFKALTELSSLKHLDLSKNPLSKISKHAFSGLFNLQDLDLSCLNLTFIESETFIGLSNLMNLDLSSNPLSRINSNSFNGLSSLQVLDLSIHNITLIEHESFVGLDKLSVLNLSTNLLGSLQSECFTGLTQLKQLDLSKNHISTISTNVYFEPLVALEKLYLREISNNSNLFNFVYFANMLHYYKHLQAIFVSDIEFISCSQFTSIITYASSRHVNVVINYDANLTAYYNELCKYEDTNDHLIGIKAALNTLVNLAVSRDSPTYTNSQLDELTAAIRSIANLTANKESYRNLYPSGIYATQSLMLITLIILTLIMSGVFRYGMRKYRKLKINNPEDNTEAVMLK